MRSLVLSAAAIAALALPARAYYHYVHFINGVAAYEKFDLRALPNQTVPVFVSDSGPQSASAFPIVLGQIRQAAAAWNSVETSALRVSFAGLKAAGQADNTPGMEVVFTNDLPPGVLAQAAATVSTAPVTGPDGLFFPIVRSVVMLNANTDVLPGPAYSETYFATALHEMGHALGLQHTFTSSAMAQGVVRNTTRTRPLDADDIAALSTLYGKPGWDTRFGSISGRITSNGQGVAMASVVALPGVGAPVSAITNPDGTYKIIGIPPGQYLLYVHPLPPNSDIRKPVDGAGAEMPASGPFETMFFPSSRGAGTGTREMGEFVPLNVDAGIELKDYGIDVQPRPSVPMYDLVTFSYFSQERQSYYFEGTAVTPAYVSMSEHEAAITFRSETGNTPTPVSATMLGGFANMRVRPCCNSQALAAYFYLPIFPMEGSRHLILNFENDAYVLPFAMTVVRRAPPVITGLAANENGAVTVKGRNFGPDTRVFFDGLEAAAAGPFQGNASEGTIAVRPPLGYSGQEAHVVVYNSDGQSSLTLDSATVAYGGQAQFAAPVYKYAVSAQPDFSIAPAALPAGSFARLEVNAANMDLDRGSVTLGLGTGDALVERLWVLDSGRALVNVRAASGAALGSSEISLISGFRVASWKTGFQLQAADPSRPAIQGVSNAVATQATIYPGGSIAISGANLGQAGATVSLNGVPLSIAAASSTLVTAAIPAGFATGPATLKLQNGSQDALPVVVPVSSAPPSIARVTLLSGQSVQSVTKGDAVYIILAGLDPEAAADAARLKVTLGDATARVLSVLPSEDGTYAVTVALDTVPLAAQAGLRVWVDGSASEPYGLAVSQPR